MHDCAAFQPFSLPEHAKTHYDLGYAAGLRAALSMVIKTMQMPDDLNNEFSGGWNASLQSLILSLNAVLAAREGA